MSSALCQNKVNLIKRYKDMFAQRHLEENKIQHYRSILNIDHIQRLFSRFCDREHKHKPGLNPCVCESLNCTNLNTFVVCLFCFTLMFVLMIVFVCPPSIYGF